MPPVAEIFYQSTLAKSDSKESLRTKREMHTLAVILDHLALGRYSEAADTAGQRMKALELAARTGSWKTAQQVELAPQDTQLTLVGDQEVEMAAKTAKKKDELDTFVNSNKGSQKRDERPSGQPKPDAPYYTWVEKGKGKGKGKEIKGKNKPQHRHKEQDKKKKKKHRWPSSD